MTKIEVYDPPMCCSSGVCGPSVDKRLVEFGAALDWLKSQGVEVARYSPTQQYDAFAENPAVVSTLNERGEQSLPLILVDGEVVCMGGYPDREELAAMAGLSEGKVKL